MYLLVSYFSRFFLEVTLKTSNSFSRSVFIYSVSCSISHWESYSRSIIQSFCQSVGQLFTFSVIHSLRQPVRQLVSYSLCQSVGQLFTFSVIHSFRQPDSNWNNLSLIFLYPVTHSVIKSVGQFSSQTVDHSAGHSGSNPFVQPATKSLAQSLTHPLAW